MFIGLTQVVPNFEVSDLAAAVKTAREHDGSLDGPYSGLIKVSGLRDVLDLSITARGIGERCGFG